jgi:hypothetical protein
VTPDDVYALIVQRSGHTQNLIIAVIVMVVVLFLFAAPASVMFLFDARNRRRQYQQNRNILLLVEKNSLLTDEQYRHKAKLIAAELRHILELKELVVEGKQEVAEVKNKVTAVAETATRIDERLPEFPSGGLVVTPTPVDPLNPPQRRAEDKK